MISFIRKLLSGDNVVSDEHGFREKCGVFASVVGILVNVLLSGIKLLAGVLSSSIAIIADGLNNLSDAGTSIVSMVSFKIAAKPADRKHPFGHARIEYVCSMIVSFIILLVGFEVLSEAVTGLFVGAATEKVFNALTYVILSISIVGKLLLGLFYRFVAKKIDSSVVEASAVDSFSDAVSTSAVLISAVITKLTNITYIDSIVGIAVSVLILISGIKILNETKNSLLGEAPVKEVVESMLSVVARYPEVIGVHDMMVHNYGPNKYIASFHAEVDGAQDVYMLHDAIDNIERDINNELGIICTIHLDPLVTNDEEVNALKLVAVRAVAEVNPDATVHDFRTVVGHTHTNLIFDIALPFEEKRDIDEIVAAVSEKVLAQRENCYCVITVDRA